MLVYNWFGYFGGFVRYCYGYSIRQLGLTKRPYYSLKEYIHGPDKVEDETFDRMDQWFVNSVVGMVSIVAICLLIPYLDAWIQILF